MRRQKPGARHWAKKLGTRLVVYALSGIIGFTVYWSWFLVDYGHNNSSPDRIGKNLALSVADYRIDNGGALPAGITDLSKELLLEKSTRLHFKRSPEQFWKWMVAERITDGEERQLIAMSACLLQKPEETGYRRAVIWALPQSDACSFSLEDAQWVEALLRDAGATAEAFEVLDWRLRSWGFNRGFWLWLSPYLIVLACGIVAAEGVLWLRRQV